MNVPVVSIVGVSGSGKTTLVEKLVKSLVKKGLRVGTLKHDAHSFEMDKEGKDSMRHKKAGSGTVVLSSPEKFAVIRDVDAEWTPERLASSFFDGVDVLIVEGYKRSSFPKIEVVRKEVSSRPVCSKDPMLLAIATDAKLKPPKGVRLLGLNDVSVMVRMVEKVVKEHSCPGVSLIVDGKPVELKPFIDGMLREAILGMIRNLKDCAKAKSIEIRIGK